MVLRNVVPEICDSAIACCTQTVLAQPMRALHTLLPPNLIVMNSKHPLRVRVQLCTVGRRRVKVRTSKGLHIVRQDDLDKFTTLRTVYIVVEYDSSAKSVFVGIA